MLPHGKFTSSKSSQPRVSNNEELLRGPFAMQSRGEGEIKKVGSEI